MFYCEVPPGEGAGGESVVSDCRRIKEDLDPGVVEKFDRLGVKYHFHVASKYDKSNEHGHSWQMMFNTEKKKDLEEVLDREGTSYFWNKDDSIKFWRILPAMAFHPKTGEQMWINHIYKKHASGWAFHPSFQGKQLDNDKYPTHSYYGDGTEIEDDVIQHIRDISWKCAVGFQMKKRDVLVMDNMRVQHARLSFTGERKLLAILGRYKDQ
ncbi:unnamed protein product [Owenia fusiformis]|nr:unnamed protein product [Owenia fusiformis]